MTAGNACQQNDATAAWQVLDDKVIQRVEGFECMPYPRNPTVLP